VHVQRQPFVQSLQPSQTQLQFGQPAQQPPAVQVAVGAADVLDVSAALPTIPPTSASVRNILAIILIAPVRENVITQSDRIQARAQSNDPGAVQDAMRNIAADQPVAQRSDGS
jgi:hypothetical protein